MSKTYQTWYTLPTLDGSADLAWAVLSIGAYRARVLGWVPALGVAFLLTHCRRSRRAPTSAPSPARHCSPPGSSRSASACGNAPNSVSRTAIALNG
ncbi:hypothetical protein [Amycolatopsis sp. PS_44_ISF1]|uniref:hypothetical protein n=1 Tax=Amycolatopsis sp. PS_44_ISF1 TaxID=2974917 RepID=UPI0028DDFA21|nr:hypothetical protein [Amycolatopsis sp. PS_44_ISF1]MDT8912301.1 hypothetical protein [Amycolatopsis sp. PS_44_ISF1]